MRTASLALLLLSAYGVAARAQEGCPVGDPCGEAARPGELAIVLLGDSGYGQGGASEWGPLAQGQLAGQLNGLCPRPDLVFFLGDNIYWTGREALFAPRFDTVYRPLFDPEQRRVHAALGNHDIKGCQVSARPAFGRGETCADALGRLVRKDAAGDVPQGQAAAPPRSPLLEPEVLERAKKVPASQCPPPSDAAYEQQQHTKSVCYATQALTHTPFGYGVHDGAPLRYYSVDWPPREKGQEGDPAARVLVVDSNTLGVHGRAEAHRSDETARTATRDALQLLWLENQLKSAPREAWRLLVMHHPPFSPRGCALRLFGRCLGGHADEPGLQEQLVTTFGGPDTRPDFVFGAHNHFYARSRPVDGSGYPPQVPGEGVRYYVTGGGGAPLYPLQAVHQRYARAGAFHHFVYLRLRGDTAYFWAVDLRGGVRDSGCFRKGENADRCIASGSYDSDGLSCGEIAPTAGECPVLK